MHDDPENRRRLEAGLCSVRALNLLAKFGEDGSAWSPEAALRVLERIKANDWKPLPSGESAAIVAKADA